MGARSKLNGAFLNGSLLIAGLIGGMAQSWVVFWLALAGLVIANLVSGEIRPTRRR